MCSLSNKRLMHGLVFGKNMENRFNPNRECKVQTWIFTKLSILSSTNQILYSLAFKFIYEICSIHCRCHRQTRGVCLSNKRTRRWVLAYWEGFVAQKMDVMRKFIPFKCAIFSSLSLYYIISNFLKQSWSLCYIYPHLKCGKQNKSSLGAVWSSSYFMQHQITSPSCHFGIQNEAVY